MLIKFISIQDIYIKKAFLSHAVINHGISLIKRKPLLQSICIENAVNDLCPTIEMLGTGTNCRMLCCKMH